MANPYHGPDGKFTSRDQAERAYSEAIMEAIDAHNFDDVARLRFEQKEMLAKGEGSHHMDIAALKEEVDSTTYLSKKEKKHEHNVLVWAKETDTVGLLEDFREEAKTLAVRNFIADKIESIENENSDKWFNPTETHRVLLQDSTDADKIRTKLGVDKDVPVQLESVSYSSRYDDWDEDEYEQAEFFVLAGGKKVKFATTPLEHDRFKDFVENGKVGDKLSVYNRYNLWLKYGETVEEFDRMFPPNKPKEGERYRASVDINHPLWAVNDLFNKNAGDKTDATISVVQEGNTLSLYYAETSVEYGLGGKEKYRPLKLAEWRDNPSEEELSSRVDKQKVSLMEDILQSMRTRRSLYY